VSVCTHFVPAGGVVRKLSHNSITLLVLGCISVAIERPFIPADWGYDMEVRRGAHGAAGHWLCSCRRCNASGALLHCLRTADSGILVLWLGLAVVVAYARCGPRF
jgi:hypothetical protein